MMMLSGGLNDWHFRHRLAVDESLRLPAVVSRLDGLLNTATQQVHDFRHGLRSGRDGQAAWFVAARRLHGHKPSAPGAAIMHNPVTGEHMQMISPDEDDVASRRRIRRSKAKEGRHDEVVVLRFRSAQEGDETGSTVV